MDIGLLDIINIIAMFQLAVFVFFLISTKAKKTSNRLLAVFLFAQILIIFNFECFRFYSVVYEACPHFFYIGTPFLWIAAPSFYLYVKSVAYSDFRFTKTQLAHFLLFAVAISYFTIAYYIYPAETKRMLLNESIYLSSTFWVAYRTATFIQLLSYNIAALFVLKNYQREIKQQYSSIQRINLSWLSFILYGFLVAWLMSAVAFLSTYYFIEFKNEVLFLDFLAFFIFFNYIFYKGLIQPQIFAGVEEKPKYAFSKLTAEEAEVYLARLTAYMENQKPFLNPEISLKDLADQLSIPGRYLSQIINVNLRQNFFDFISKYRVEESKKMLCDLPGHKTVLEVLYEVGFNSKSSFNAAFKKFTGTTPTRFKKMK